MKLNVWFIILGVLLLLVLSEKSSEVVIPDEAIRFRVIASSNTIESQRVKSIVTKKVSEKLEGVISGTSEYKDAQNALKLSVNVIKNIVGDTLEDIGVDQSFNVTYGVNYFPEKRYKGLVYKEGYYESLVIELGEAEGDNFWCVLYPPICMLDTNDTEDIEYKSYVVELIQKYTK